MSVSDTFKNLITVVTDIPESIQLVFQKIGYFIDGFVIVTLNIYVLLLFILFFAIIIGVFKYGFDLYLLSKKYSKIFTKLLRL